MMAKRALQTRVCRTTLLSLITACSLLNTSLAVQSSWLFEYPFESSNCINTIPIIQTSTQLQCATLCSQSDGCVGFFYKNDTLSCLHIDPTSSSECMININLQWKSWKKVKESTLTTTSEQTTSPTTITQQTTTPTTPTTTNEETTTPATTSEQTYTPITTMGQPTCPNTLPINTYTSTTLSDNTQFTFLFVQDAVLQTDALSLCLSYNGTLVQIVTAPKMDFLLDCLDKTFEGHDDRFWIDAIKVDGLWKTSDGKAVLSDVNYWQDGAPTSNTCVVLQGVLYNYKMRATSCTTIKSFICEKTI